MYEICANYSGDVIFDPIECQFTHGNAAGISITVDAPPDAIFKNGFDGRLARSKQPRSECVSGNVFGESRGGIYRQRLTLAD